MKAVAAGILCLVYVSCNPISDQIINFSVHCSIVSLVCVRKSTLKYNNMDDGVVENTDTIIFVPSLILFVNLSIIFYGLSERQWWYVVELEIDFRL